VIPKLVKLFGPELEGPKLDLNQGSKKQSTLKCPGQLVGPVLPSAVAGSPSEYGR
jgi:hypothetical protein